MRGVDGRHLAAAGLYFALFAVERAVAALPGEGTLTAGTTLAWAALFVAGLLFAAGVTSAVLLAFETLVLLSLAFGVLQPADGDALALTALTAARIATLVVLRRNLRVSARVL